MKLALILLLASLTSHAEPGKPPKPKTMMSIDLDAEMVNGPRRSTLEVFAMSPASVVSMNEEDYYLWKLEKQRLLLEKKGTDFPSAVLHILKNGADDQGGRGRYPMAGMNLDSPDADYQWRALTRFAEFHFDRFIKSDPHVNQVFDVYEKVWDLPVQSSMLLEKMLTTPGMTHRDFEYAMIAILARKKPEDRAARLAEMLPGYARRTNTEKDPLAAQLALLRAIAAKDAGWLVRDQEKTNALRCVADDVIRLIANNPDKRRAVETLALLREPAFGDLKLQDFADAYLTPLLQENEELKPLVRGWKGPARKKSSGEIRRPVVEDVDTYQKWLKERAESTAELRAKEEALRVWFRTNPPPMLEEYRPPWCSRAWRRFLSWVN